MMKGSVYPDCTATENEHTANSIAFQDAPSLVDPKREMDKPTLRTEDFIALSATDKASRKKKDWSSGDSNNEVDLLSISTLSHFTGRYLITFPVSL